MWHSGHDATVQLTRFRLLHSIWHQQEGKSPHWDTVANLLIWHLLRRIPNNQSISWIAGGQLSSFSSFELLRKVGNPNHNLNANSPETSLRSLILWPTATDITSTPKNLFALGEKLLSVILHWPKNIAVVIVLDHIFISNIATQFTSAHNKTWHRPNR